MFQQRFQQIIALSALLMVAASAFSPPTTAATRSPSHLNGVWMEGNYYDDNESSLSEGGGHVLMSRAIACANSESCGLDEAQSYLDDLMMIDSRLDSVSGVVSDLREKIRAEQSNTVAPHKLTLHFMNVLVGVFVVSAVLHDVTAVSNLSIDVDHASTIYSAFDPFMEL